MLFRSPPHRRTAAPPHRRTAAPPHRRTALYRTALHCHTICARAAWSLAGSLWLWPEAAIRSAYGSLTHSLRELGEGQHYANSSDTQIFLRIIQHPPHHATMPPHNAQMEEDALADVIHYSSLNPQLKLTQVAKEKGVAHCVTSSWTPGRLLPTLGIHTRNSHSEFTLGIQAG